MSEMNLTLRFEGVAPGEANRHAQELCRILLDRAPEITVSRIREDRDAQDLGSVLELVLVHAAILSTAEAIKTWLELRPKVSVTIGTDKGKIMASHVTPDLATEISKLALTLDTATELAERETPNSD